MIEKCKNARTNHIGCFIIVRKILLNFGGHPSTVSNLLWYGLIFVAFNKKHNISGIIMDDHIVFIQYNGTMDRLIDSV